MADLAFTHAEALSRVIGIMDLSIQDAFSMMSKSAIPVEEWHGSAVGANVRQFATRYFEVAEALEGTQLRFEGRSNLGLRLTGPRRVRIRVRACLRDVITKQPLQVVPAPWESQPSLFRDDVSDRFEYALFWSTSKKADGIGRAFLGAVDFKQSPNPALYALLPLATKTAIAADWMKTPPAFLDKLDAMDDQYGWQQNLGESEGPA